jgi:23S rRNA (cytosine1962-C5)-methyltransferase
MPPRDDVRVRLRKPLRRTLRRGHPWIFRDALARIEVRPGTVVTVVDERDRFIARGWAEEGPIAVRVLTIRDEPIDRELLQRRVVEAASIRDRVVPPETNAYRLLHGEGDRLPGVVCDVYGEFAALKLDGTAVLAHKDALVDVLVPVLQARAVRGLVLRTGRRQQQRIELAWGHAPPEDLVVEEQGVRLPVDLVAGQKTGLFLDHRTSRRQVRRLAQGLRVLDLYAYVGGFSASAGLGGARSVVTVDVAAGAIDAARRTWELNGLAADVQRRVVADVPTFLGAQEDAGNRFELIVADPPSFAPNEAARAGAIAAYRMLHRSCLRLLAPGGYLLAASCSSHIRRQDFEDALIEAADETARNLQVLDRWGAPPDHPCLLGFPEGEYLKVILTKATD